jgi:hypothetical protein
VKRSFPLCVEQLEDRCVPAVDPVLQAVAPAPALLPNTTLMIDPGLIHPDSQPAPRPTQGHIPVVRVIMLPIGNAFMP